MIDRLTSNPDFFINGFTSRYYPYFIIQLASGEYLILETKGMDNQQNRVKREFLDEWVKAVNTQGGFGRWHWDVSFHPSDMEGVLKKYCNNAKS